MSFTKKGPQAEKQYATVAFLNESTFKPGDFFGGPFRIKTFEKNGKITRVLEVKKEFLDATFQEAVNALEEKRKEFSSPNTTDSKPANNFSSSGSAANSSSRHTKRTFG